MDNDFKEQKWYAQLNARDKKIVKALRKAQFEQGDMDILKE